MKYLIIEIRDGIEADAKRVGVHCELPATFVEDRLEDLLELYAWPAFRQLQGEVKAGKP